MRSEEEADIRVLASQEEIELVAQIAQLEERLKSALFPQESTDNKNAIMEIRAGVGGIDAKLFTADLFRMYTRYAQLNDWAVDVVDVQNGPNGEIKEVVCEIRGRGVYGRLKHESGGHRIQRVPPTESRGRVHTSVATVAVLPEAEELDISIKPADIKADIFHSKGHGGQHVQKVATAVRLTHLHTGIIAVCQDERSLKQNREKAMRVLCSRILAQKTSRQNNKIAEKRRSQIGDGRRSERVRTYNVPQSRVTDHRSKTVSHNLEAVLNGDIDPFIDAMIQVNQVSSMAS